MRYAAAGVQELKGGTPMDGVREYEWRAWPVALMLLAGLGAPLSLLLILFLLGIGR